MEGIDILKSTFTSTLRRLKPPLENAATVGKSRSASRRSGFGVEFTTTGLIRPYQLDSLQFVSVCYPYFWNA